jgi:DNA-directed RNA polymerase specialized sigma24 family protein
MAMPRREGVSLKPELLSQLQGEDWGTIGKALTVFGIYWARRYPWRTGDGWDLAKGSSVEDIVQTVIRKTFDGTRNFDPSQGKLLSWLRDQVKSEIDALFKSASQKYDQPVSTGQPGVENLTDPPDIPAASDAAVSAIFRLSPEDLVLKDEAIRDRVDAIFEATRGDAALVAIVDAIMDGCSPKAQALADRLGVEVKEIYTRTRRLRRRATKILEDQNDRR